MGFVPFEELRVFQVAEALSDLIWNIVSGWNYFKKTTIGVQLVKAADSIGANIAEGAGRGAPKDNKRFIRISRGSFNETRYWLRRASKRNLLSDENEQAIKEIIDMLGPSLNAYLSSIGTPATGSQTPKTKN